MNKCGSCQACCEVLGVEGLKTKMTKCKHQGHGNCSIYSTRPEGCRHFKCSWLLSGWDEKYRPDKSGIMVTTFKGEEKHFAYRLKDKIDMTLFDLLEKNKETLIGIDARNINGNI